MQWLLTIAIVIVLIVISFVLFIFMPKARVFFDTIKEGDIFSQNQEELKKSLANIDIKKPIVPIYGDGVILNYEYPFLYQLIQCLPEVKYAGILILKPVFNQTPQYGFKHIANTTLRHFYCVKQSATQKSGIWIDGERKFFNEGEWICGDMSRENSLFNKNKKNTSVIVFVDIDRPKDINIGNSINDDISKDEILKHFVLNI
jgi:hypothetical protein